MSDMSPAPGTPQTGTKAYVATGLSAAVVFVLLWIADTGAFTPKEIAWSIVQALVAAGIVGIPTYSVKNKPV